MTGYTGRGYPYPQPGDRIAKTTAPEDSIRQDFQALAEAVNDDVQTATDSLDQKIDAIPHLDAETTGDTVKLNWQEMTFDYVADTVGDTVSASPAYPIPHSTHVPRVEDGKIPESLLPDGMSPEQIDELKNVFAQLFSSAEFAEIILGGLSLSMIDGNGGQRLLVKGRDSNPGTMAYVEVAAARQGHGSDVGGALGGYQAHWVGDGTTPSNQDRLYWGVELTELGHTYWGRDDLDGMVQIFVSSRNGVHLRPMVLAANGRPAMAFHGQYKNLIEVLRGTGFVIDDRTWPGSEPSTLSTPLVFRREGAINQKMESYSDETAGFPSLRLGKHRGTVEAPGNAVAGDTIGSFEFGHSTSTLDNPTNEGWGHAASIKAYAVEDWDTTHRGSRLEVHTTRPGGTGEQVQVSFEEPNTPSETALLIRLNKDGTKTEQKVLVGPPDSGGTGYRALRITN